MEYNNVHKYSEKVMNIKISSRSLAYSFFPISCGFGPYIFTHHLILIVAKEFHTQTPNISLASEAKRPPIFSLGVLLVSFINAYFCLPMNICVPMIKLSIYDAKLTCTDIRNFIVMSDCMTVFLISHVTFYKTVLNRKLNT